MRPGSERWRRVLVILCLTALGWTAGTFAEPPAVPSPLSPGGPDRAETIETACPTFSWSSAGDFDRFELTLIETDNPDTRPVAGEEPDAVFHVSVSGRARSWTPSVDRCVREGRPATWFVRGIVDGLATAWSRGRRLLLPGRELDDRVAAFVKAAGARTAARGRANQNPSQEVPQRGLLNVAFQTDGTLEVGDLVAGETVNVDGEILSTYAGVSTAGSARASIIEFNIYPQGKAPELGAVLLGQSVATILEGKHVALLAPSGSSTLKLGQVQASWIEVTGSIVHEAGWSYAWTPPDLSGGGSGYTNIPIIYNLTSDDQVRLDTAGASCGNRPIIGVKLEETDDNQIGIQLKCGSSTFAPPP